MESVGLREKELPFLNVQHTTGKKKAKLLMQAPPTDPRTLPAIRMKAQVPCGQQQKM